MLWSGSACGLCISLDSACPLTIAAVSFGALQEMSRNDQRTQMQMVHLDTEIKELAKWLDNLARMAHVLTAAGKAGLLKNPERGDFPSTGWWEPAGVSRGEGEWRISSIAAYVEATRPVQLRWSWLSMVADVTMLCLHCIGAGSDCWRKACQAADLRGL